VTLMVSGWWLLAALWAGACFGILVVTWLHHARHRDDSEQPFLSGAQAILEGKQARPDAWPGQAGGVERKRSAPRQQVQCE